jgi:hypothetical protein
MFSRLICCSNCSTWVVTFQNLFLVLFIFSPMIMLELIPCNCRQWLASHHECYCSKFQHWISVFVFMVVIHQDIGQWKLAGTSQACGFSEYILCQNNASMHIIAGLVILLMLIANNNSSSNNSIIDLLSLLHFWKLIVELYKKTFK